MELKRKRVIDKSTWGEGPWQTEPDRVEFVHAGLACLAQRHPEWGHWCGYAAVPKGHPAYGKAANDVEAEFHMGLNYASPCSGLICHAPQPGMPDDVWWLGGDFGHTFDVGPGRNAFERARGGKIGELLESLGRNAVESACGGERRQMPLEKYRDLPYVRQEIEKLAEQLAVMTRGDV